MLVYGICKKLYRNCEMLTGNSKISKREMVRQMGTSAQLAMVL